ncbi:hypothetical protein BPAE_0083g00490 [Botrytis paeoniae]|uniref:Uncharacterized protein n=1 Tax=Botrytis paeoniae TaxID=278948 RepID=A0A4Z1FKS1_9HELO|nr:hypothetical protein BPAE_0083g00490 [Botrytis paeoniae]
MCTQYQYRGRCWCNGRTGQTRKPPRLQCANFETKIYGIKCPNCIHEAAAAAVGAEVQAEAEAARILLGMRNGRC